MKTQNKVHQILWQEKNLVYLLFLADAGLCFMVQNTLGLGLKIRLRIGIGIRGFKGKESAINNAKYIPPPGYAGASHSASPQQMHRGSQEIKRSLYFICCESSNRFTMITFFYDMHVSTVFQV